MDDDARVVLGAMATHPDADHYPLDIAMSFGWSADRVRSSLSRLETAGLVSSRWDDRAGDRSRAHAYRLTASSAADPTGA